MDGDIDARQFQQRCVRYIDAVLRKIDTLDETIKILDDGLLSELGVRKAQPLDVDGSSVEFGPRFFTPRFSLDEATRKTTDFLAEHSFCGRTWLERCRLAALHDPGFELGPDDDPDGPHPLCSAETEAEHRMWWMYHATGVELSDWLVSDNRGVWSGSHWYFVDDPDLDPTRAFRLPRFSAINNSRYVYNVYMAMVFDGPSTDKPHMGAIVLESTVSGEGEVLRSEVAAAIALLRHQFHRGDFRRHCILPSIVFSFQHDRCGRITQFYFNGQSLVLRQSRLLDFWGDQPTTDAYQVIRWLANRPIGETRFVAVEEEDSKRLWNDRETVGGKLPVDVRSA